MNAKKPWLSKTLWVMVATLVSTLVPAVREWLANNPVTVVQALAAIGVVLRFVTSGKVTLSDDSGGGGAAGVWLALAVPVFLLCGGCSAAEWQAFREGFGPVRVGITADDASVSYGPKSGLEVTVDARSGK